MASSEQFGLPVTKTCVGSLLKPDYVVILAEAQVMPLLIPDCTPVCVIPPRLDYSCATTYQVEWWSIIFEFILLICMVATVFINAFERWAEGVHSVVIVSICHCV